MFLYLTYYSLSPLLLLLPPLSNKGFHFQLGHLPPISLVAVPASSRRRHWCCYIWPRHRSSAGTAAIRIWPRAIASAGTSAAERKGAETIRGLDDIISIVAARSYSCSSSSCCQWSSSVLTLSIGKSYSWSSLRTLSTALHPMPVRKLLTFVVARTVVTLLSVHMPREHPTATLPLKMEGHCYDISLVLRDIRTLFAASLL